MEEKTFSEAKTGNCQARRDDRCFVVRLESRAREFVNVARQTLLRREPKGNQVSADRKVQGKGTNLPESHLPDPKPGELPLGKVKPLG